MKKKGRLGQWHHKVDLLILKVFGSQGQAVPPSQGQSWDGIKSLPCGHAPGRSLRDGILKVVVVLQFLLFGLFSPSGRNSGSLHIPSPRRRLAETPETLWA